MIQSRKRAHLALRLPEIVSHIQLYLMDTHREVHTDLYPCLFVNRLWYGCARRLLWRDVRFEGSKDTHERLLQFASALAPAVKTSLFPVTATPGLATDEGHCQAVRSLSILKVKTMAIDSCLFQIGTRAPRIEKLNMYICDNVSDWAIRPFAKHGNLVHLSLAGCSHITDKLILLVAKTCADLQYLDLRACSHVSDVSIAAIANHCPKLRHLNVGRVRDGERITDKSINLVAKKTQITVLGLAGCHITDKCMELLTEMRGHSLERISVNNCPKIGNGTVRALRQHCKKLFVFEMKECSLVNDWETITVLLQRKVMLTLCGEQNEKYLAWSHDRRKPIEIYKALQ